MNRIPQPLQNLLFEGDDLFFIVHQEDVFIALRERFLVRYQDSFFPYFPVMPEDKR